MAVKLNRVGYLISSDKLKEVRFVFPHPPFSPDLAASHYLLFPRFKEWHSNEEITPQWNTCFALFELEIVSKNMAVFSFKKHTSIVAKEM